MTWTRKSSRSIKPAYRGRNRFEHWCRDNQVYFLTARCRDKFPAFASEDAKAVFWDRFEHYTAAFGFVPWVTSLMDNHYHILGYLRIGENLGAMMQRLHGSVAKLVNDILENERVGASRLSGTRLDRFWRDVKGKEYFDGCIHDEKQCRPAYRYTLTQSERHGVVEDYRLYPHTRVNVELERGLKRALELNAFLEGVRYKRYDG